MIYSMHVVHAVRSIMAGYGVFTAQKPTKMPMSSPNQYTPSVIRKTTQLLSSGRWPARLFSAGSLFLLAGALSASAAAVVLRAPDAVGTSSFTGSTNWNPTGVPAAGNTYSTAFLTRVPADTTSRTFAGDSLSVNTGARLIGKTTGTTQVTTINNLILNGGTLEQATANSDSFIETFAGNINVASSSGIGAIGSTANNNASFETMNVTAIISGSAPLVISGGTINAGANTGVVKLSAANPYSGIMTVTNGFSGSTAVIASAVNRILQLANVNALSNATVSLVSSVANPMSFLAASNTAPFKVGALAGNGTQTLLDTAGTAVTLSAGGNNASTTFSGVLTDGGNLAKVGTGTLTLTGANTYYGTTTISGGSLQLGNGGVNGVLATSSTLTDNANLTINRTNAVVQGTDFSGSPITGTGSFTQAGAGTTTLNAANSYSGATTVNAGKLIVSSAQTGTGAVTVANGAKLEINISGTSQLSPSTLTLGTSAATTLYFDSLSSTTIAPITAGTLAVGGLVTVTINSGTFAAGNSYPLIHWTTSGPADASSFTLGTSPGLSATFSVSGSTLYLNVAAVSDIWSGLVNGNWDAATANWTGNATVFANGQAVLFDDTAAGNTSVTVTVPVQPGNMVFNNSSLTYTITSSGANLIGGSGALTKNGNGTIMLAGGVNTYTGVTAVNGGTLSIGALANGGAASDIGAATAASANLVLNGGTLQYTGANTTTDHGATLGAGGGTVQIYSGGTVLADSGVIVGSGALTETGGGILTLSGASTFSGGVTLSAGQLNINYGGSSSANSAIGTGPLTITANTTIDNTSGSDVTVLANNAQFWNGTFTYAGSANNLNLGTGAVVNPITNIVIVSANTLTVGGAISGIGGITKAGYGTLVLTASNTFSGAVDLTAGTLAIGNNASLGTGLLNFDGGSGGSTIQSIDGTAHIITNPLNFSGAGAVSIYGGTGNLKFTSTPTANGTDKTLIVNNPQTEFSGVLGGASGRNVGGTGILVLSGTNTYSGATTISSGANLQLGNGGASGSLSTSSVITDNGTLIFNRSDTISQGSQFNGTPITGSGGVIQAGSGSTTLNAANTYSGTTAVNNGELFITPACQSGGEFDVANGAKFGISASSLTSGSATIGVLALGTGGATTIDFSYGFVGNPTNATLTAGAVTINGNSAIRIGGNFVPGTFPVLKYASLTGTFNSTVVGPRGVAATLYNDVANQTIDVIVSSVGGGIVWSGTNNLAPNLWDLNTTTNWVSGGLGTVYIETVPPGDAVTFNDLGSGTVLLSNTASPSSVTISNVAVNYTFQGSGQITSSGGLTKSGTGAVTLNLPGTFAGNTVVSNGSLSLGASQSFANLAGNGTINSSTGAPVLTVNSSQDTTYSGAIGGALGLTKTGSNTLTLTASNGFSGNVFVKSGAVALSSGGIFGSTAFSSIGQTATDNGTLTLTGNASFTNNADFNVGDVGSSAGTLNISNNASVTVNSFFVGSANGAGSTASGTVNQASGTLNQFNTGTGLFDIGGRTSASGVGVYNLSGGTLISAAGIRVGNAGNGTMNQSGGTVVAFGGVNLAHNSGSSGTYNLNGGTLLTSNVTSSTGANAIFNFNGGVLQATNPTVPFFTNLTAAYILAGGAIFNSAGNDIVVSQSLVDGGGGGGLTKLGIGMLSLTGLGSSYSGPTLVLGGTLNLAQATVTSLNDLTVSNATLTLALTGGASSIAAGNLTLTGNTGLNLNYDLVSGTPVAAISATGSLTATGTNIINVNAYGLAVGQFPLVVYTGTPLANLNNFAPGILPPGVSATLSNNVANSSVDLVVTAVSETSWIPLTATDAFGTSGFDSAGTWQDGNPPSSDKGYFTRTFALRSPADANPYTFAGSALSIDVGGRFIMKGTGGQVLTVTNLIINGGLVDYANAGDNFTETLAGNITLQPGMTNYIGALSAGAVETFYVASSIGGSGGVQFGGPNLNNGQDTGTVVLTGTNTYTGPTVVTTGTLLVNGSVGSSALTVNANGTLGGAGIIGGPVTVQTGGKLAPGTPTRGALTAAIGTLTDNNTVTLAGTAVMKIDRSAATNSDQLAATSVVVNAGAILTVSNIGSTNFVAGDKFTLFSAPISGSFTTVTLPVLPGTNVYWTNNLALNGTIAVVAVVTVNTNSPVLTNSYAGGNLTLSWPTDHIGWTLQAQTNSLSSGLGTNWVDVAGSVVTNSVAIPVNPANGAVFYRLKW